MHKLISVTTLILIGISLGWNFHSKWMDRRAALLKEEKKAAQEEEQKAAQDRVFAKTYGGNSLTILGFYANPGTIHAGEKSQLCYSVNNADTVRIEPPVKYVWPSLSRCVDVTPKKETVYKLIAKDASSQTQTATTTVKVE